MVKKRRFPSYFPGRYVLMGKLAVPEPDLLTWGRWLEDHYKERVVAKTQIGGIEVSTVFLGLDHNFMGGLPILFETMIFRGGKGDDTFRCGTWEEAEKQHEDAVALVRAEIKDKVND